MSNTRCWKRRLPALAIATSLLGGCATVGCLKICPGFRAIREPLSGTSHMPESGGGRVERSVVDWTGQKWDRPRLSHVLNG